MWFCQICCRHESLDIVSPWWKRCYYEKFEGSFWSDFLSSLQILTKMTCSWRTSWSCWSKLTIHRNQINSKKSILIFNETNSPYWKQFVQYTFPFFLLYVSKKKRKYIISSGNDFSITKLMSFQVVSSFVRNIPDRVSLPFCLYPISLSQCFFHNGFLTCLILSLSIL